MIAVYEAAKTTWQVEAKVASERQVNSLPPQLQDMEVEVCVNIVNAAGDEELSPGVTPSRADLERNIGEITSAFKAESLSNVTNQTQQHTNRANTLGVEASGFSTKEFAVAVLKCSERLRRRLTMLGVCWVFAARMKCLSKSQLVFCGMDIFDKYIKLVLGPKLGGMATVDEHDKPISNPTLKHVLIYDLAIRKELARLLNAGVAIRTAFRTACKDTETRQVHFSANVSIEIGIVEYKACTAHGLKESCPSVQVNPGGNQTATGTKRPAAEPEESKAKRNRLQKKAKEAELKAQLKAAQQLALQNGGGGPRGGARTQNVRGQPFALQNGGNGYARGGNCKGNGKPKLKDRTADGKAIWCNWDK